MRISLKAVRKYTDNAPKYIDGLVFVQSGTEPKDVDAMKMWLRRLCKDADGLSFLLVTSSHESKGNIKKEKIYTGNAGRPKTIVQGKKAIKHIHGLIVNENENEKNSIGKVRKELQTYCKKRREKRKNLKQQKIKNAWTNNLSIVPYMIRQADNIYRDGNFEFDYFDCVYYMPDDPQADNYDNIFEDI